MIFLLYNELVKKARKIVRQKSTKGQKRNRPQITLKGKKKNRPQMSLKKILNFLYRKNFSAHNMCIRLTSVE